MVYPIIEFYLAIKKNEALIHVTTWMNLENIRPHIIQFHLYKMFRLGESIQTGMKSLLRSGGTDREMAGWG